MIKDSIASARSAIDTINYWKRILPLYFPVEKGFDLIHQCNREDVLILRLPCLQQSPDLRQQDIQCVIMISAEDKDRPACKDKESYAYAYLMDLDPDSHDRKAFGINASGSHFSLFKITGNKHNSLIPISNLEEMTVGRVLESKFDAIHKEAYEGQCKVIIQSANNIYITAHLDDSFSAFTLKRRADALPMTTSTITTAVRHKFFKAEYEALVRSAGESSEGDFNRWWTILSCMEMENSTCRISRRYTAKTGILSLDYILSSSAQAPKPASTSRCLIMVYLYRQPQPEWKVSDSCIYELLRTEVADDCIHGVLAYGQQFLLFRVHKNGDIHHLMGIDGFPQDFRDLLNDAEIRERFEGFMNGIVPKEVHAIVSAQGHGNISRVQATRTSRIASHPQACSKDSNT